jgi:hypothetical protein
MSLLASRLLGIVIVVEIGSWRYYVLEVGAG